MSDINLLKYPIGKYQPPEIINQKLINTWILQIKTLADRIFQKIKNLNENKFLYSYRKGGWNIQQLIYHLTDSHSNSYIRFKWALTENNPMIKAYDEQAWAITPEVANTDPMEALAELRMINNRIARVVEAMKPHHLNRTFIHPEKNNQISLAILVGMYAWHGNHHLEHIKLALDNPVINYEPIN